MPDETIVYKVLGADGEAIHGGSGQWHLPTQNDDGTWGPGAWMPKLRGTRICTAGVYHLTTKPFAWWSKPGDTVWVAEYAGAIIGTEEDKIGVHEARLLRPAEWRDFLVFGEGQHVVTGTQAARAFGSATVRAWDSATVEASGSATVEAWGSATVEAWGSATVRAWDSATVISTAYHRADTTVSLADEAAHVDRRGAHVVCRVAGD